MASSLQQQNIKHEKANGIMRNLQRKQMLEYMYHLLNISFTLFLFWRFSGFTITFQAFWHAYAVLIPLFKNPFYAFLLLNAIIFILYALPNKNNNAGVSSPVNSDKSRKITAPKTESSLRVEDISMHPKAKTGSARVENTSIYPKTKAESLLEKQKVYKSEVGESSPNFEEKTVTSVTKTPTTTKCCTSTTVNTNVVDEEKSYRRVQSANYERRRVVAAAGRELKRFGTGLKKEPQTRLCHVEELSKDEFNRVIEDFIAKHKRKLLEEELRFQKITQENLAIPFPP